MTDENTQLKASIRALVRERLGAIDGPALDAASVRACDALMALPIFERSATVMAYMPLPGEVDVLPIIERCLATNRRVCVPRVQWDSRDMTPVQVTSLEDAAFETGKHGLRVPRDAVFVASEQVDMVIVPGLAFDAAGHRVGRGGGFYDRFLAKLHEGAVKVAIAFEAQMIDEPRGVPRSAWDVAVDVVVTDQRVVRVQDVGPSSFGELSG